MPAQNAKNNKSNSTESTEPEEKSHIQEQLLDAIKRSQDATCRSLAPGARASRSWWPSCPIMPKMPTLDSLPKPGEVTDQFFDFAHKLMASQQEFVKKLIDTLPGHAREARGLTTFGSK
jgi:hypothetical protein